MRIYKIKNAYKHFNKYYKNKLTQLFLCGACFCLSLIGTSGKSVAEQIKNKLPPISVYNSQKDFSINYSIRPTGVLDPFIGSTVELDSFNEYQSYSNQHYHYAEEAPQKYNLTAGVSYKLLKALSINFNPATQKFSSDFDLFSLRKKTKLKLRLNRKKVKATMTYKW